MSIGDYAKLPNHFKFNARDNQTGEVIRCYKETSNDTVFLFSKGSSRRGYRIGVEAFFAHYDLMVKTDSEKTSGWHNRLKRCENRLRRSGLWADLVPIFHNLQQVNYADWKLLRNLYWDYRFENSGEVDLTQYRQKYPFMFDTDGKIIYDYVRDLCEVQTKSMNFGWQNNQIKQEIAKAIATRTKYSTGRIQVNYDVSFSYDPEKQMAWYAEEYRHCGNGHYYLAIDNSGAIFCEND